MSSAISNAIGGRFKDTATKTANYTAVSLEHVLCDVAVTGTFTVSMPASSAGAMVRLTLINDDVANDRYVVVAGNGSNIEAVSGTNNRHRLRYEGDSLLLRYVGGGCGWAVLDKPREVEAVALSWNAPGDDATTGVKKAYFRVTEKMEGMDLIKVHLEVATAGTTGVQTVDVNKNGTTMLSTKLTVDSTETGSDTAATAAVIDAAADHVVEGDIISVDVDGIQTTAAKGEVVTLIFR